MGVVQGGGGQDTSGGVNWPRCNSKAKSSACAERLASDNSLCCKTETGVVLWHLGSHLEENGRKRSTCGCTDPSTRLGTEQDLQ